MRQKTFQKGQRLSLTDVNTLRSNQALVPGMMKNGNGTYQRRTAFGGGVAAEGQFGEVTVTLAYPDAEDLVTPEGVAQYTVKLADGSFVHPRPLAQEANESDLINDPPDMRLFAPWFQVTDIVPIVMREVTVGGTTETLPFFDVQMTRVKEPGEHAQSLFWDDTSHRLIAGFG